MGEEQNDGVRVGDVVGGDPGLEVIEVKDGMARLKLRGINGVVYERPTHVVAHWKRVGR